MTTKRARRSIRHRRRSLTPPGRRDGKVRVVVQVPAAVDAAIRRLAREQGRYLSEVYSEAAAAHLTRIGGDTR